MKGKRSRARTTHYRGIVVKCTFSKASDSEARKRAKTTLRVVKASGLRPSAVGDPDVTNAIHATPVNTRCTFNARVMSRSCRACSASRARIDPCNENTRLGSLTEDRCWIISIAYLERCPARTGDFDVVSGDLNGAKHMYVCVCFRGSGIKYSQQYKVSCFFLHRKI